MAQLPILNGASFRAKFDTDLVSADRIRTLQINLGARAIEITGKGEKRTPHVVTGYVIPRIDDALFAFKYGQRRTQLPTPGVEGYDCVRDASPRGPTADHDPCGLFPRKRTPPRDAI